MPLLRIINRFKGLSIALTEIDAQYTPIARAGGGKELQQFRHAGGKRDETGERRRHSAGARGQRSDIIRRGTIVESGISVARKFKGKTDSRRE